MPVSRKTVQRLTYVRAVPLLFPPSGMYTYSLNQLEREICHFRQKSWIEVAVYGSRKFSINVKPNIFPSPIAMSE